MADLLRSKECPTHPGLLVLVLFLEKTGPTCALAGQAEYVRRMGDGHSTEGTELLTRTSEPVGTVRRLRCKLRRLRRPGCPCVARLRGHLRLGSDALSQKSSSTSPRKPRTAICRGSDSQTPGMPL